MTRDTRQRFWAAVAVWSSATALFWGACSQPVEPSGGGPSDPRRAGRAAARGDRTVGEGVAAIGETAPGEGGLLASEAPEPEAARSGAPSPGAPPGSGRPGEPEGRAAPAESAEGSRAPGESTAPARAAGDLPPEATLPEGGFASPPGEWAMWGGSAARNMVNWRERGIPHEWDVETGKNIKWRAGLGSQSYGNPVVAEGKIFVGTNNDRQRNPNIKGDKGVIMCFREEDGKFLWQATHDKLSSGRVNDWPEQGICSSPVCENGRIYYVSNRAEVVCADSEGFGDGENDGPYKDEKYTDPVDGDFVWIYDMIHELGVFPHNLATCSPLVVGDLVYLVTSNGVERDHITIPSPRSPSFIALDKKTGKLVWERGDPGENILHGQWSCPAYGVAGGRPQVVFPGGDGWAYAFEPRTGKLLWKFDLNPKDSKWELGGLGTRNNIIATPVFAGEALYLAVGQDPEHGYGIGHLYKIDATGEGDVTETRRVWHYGDKEFSRSLSTVAVADGLVYAADLNGFLHCLDEKTGRPYWVYDTLAAVWGSPAVIDGKVFLGDEDGDVVVIRHRSGTSLGGGGSKPEVLAETNMENSVYTTPVATKGVLYIANRTTLFAIANE